MKTKKKKLKMKKLSLLVITILTFYSCNQSTENKQ